MDGLRKFRQCVLTTVAVVLNPFMPNGFPYAYQLDQSISVIRVVACWVVFFIFIQILIEHSVS